jgi:lysozyme family protein
MAKVQLTEVLRSEYQSLFDLCQIKTSKAVEVDRLVSTLIGNKQRYARVGDPFGIPWSIIAIIHNMECSQNFDEHLHNGDPLTARSIHEPRGRPSSGNPPFTWEDSAADALAVGGLTRSEDWSLPDILYCLEGYNGWGYRLYHPEVKSPYLSLLIRLASEAPMSSPKWRYLRMTIWFRSKGIFVLLSSPMMMVVWGRKA